MAYVINKSDGTALVTLEDATVDNSTSLTLVGRNYIGYGEAQNENYLFLLENFAHDTAPLRPIAGQIWFDNTINVIKLYDGTKWVEAGAAALSATPPLAPPLGAFWFKTGSGTLHTWDGSQWVLIGPESAEGFGLTRARSTSLLSDTGIRYPVIELTVNDSVIGIISSNSFTISSSNAIPGFLNLVAGITLNSQTNVSGNLQGNASTATALDIKRTINNVGFDGRENITIKASTTNKLISGDYIVGEDFDGSTALTWSVDATSSNTMGKVVARNASGGFSAGLITADLSGNVTGNVTASSGTSSFDVIRANSFIGPTLSGNALTATELETPRKINGVDFKGNQDITITASARTLTDTALANNVINSALTTVGTLTSLDVLGNIEVNSNLTITSSGTNSQLNASRSLTLSADDGTDTAEVKLISPNDSSLAGQGSNGGFAPLTNNDMDLGKSNLKWDNVYANLFIGDLQGNADTATLATTATNIAGGAAGSLAYQTASGATSLLPAGTAGLVLHTGGTAGPPYWGSPIISDLVPGAYLNGTSYDGQTARQFDVDATSANTASKVVARDASGNFSAGTITANLTGNATTATTATNNVLKVGDTMTGFLTLHANPTANLHAATKQYVDAATQGVNPYWAGATTLANVQATYASFPTGTKVAFWNERVYNAPRNGNGGNATVYDRYKQTVQKQANGTWLTVG